MSTRRGFFAGLAGTLALMHIGAHPAKAASGLVNGQSDALGAESIGTPITITAIGLGANALVVLSIEANAGEDIFGLHIEKFGAARDGEFDCFITAENGGQDCQFYVNWIAVNP